MSKDDHEVRGGYFLIKGENISDFTGRSDLGEQCYAFSSPEHFSKSDESDEKKEGSSSAYVTSKMRTDTYKRLIDAYSSNSVDYATDGSPLRSNREQTPYTSKFSTRHRDSKHMLDDHNLASTIRSDDDIENHDSSKASENNLIYEPFVGSSQQSGREYSTSSEEDADVEEASGIENPVRTRIEIIRAWFRGPDSDVGTDNRASKERKERNQSRTASDNSAENNGSQMGREKASSDTEETPCQQEIEKKLRAVNKKRLKHPKLGKRKGYVQTGNTGLNSWPGAGAIGLLKSTGKTLCPQCFAVVHRDNYETHAAVHFRKARPNLYVCFWCQKSFSEEEGLVVHYSSEHYRCPFCRLLSGKAANRLEHIKRCKDGAKFHALVY